MIQVNSEYLKAIASVTRNERIKGAIYFYGTGEILHINDENVLQNSLTVDERICSGKYEIGTFNTAQMKLAVYDDNALEHDFMGAVIRLNYGIMLENGEYFDVPLGIFIINSVKRRHNKVYLTAFDYSVKFDAEKIDIENETDNIYNTLKAVCLASGVGLGTTEDEILALPNGDIKISIQDKQLQTNRDCVMWIAALIGCYARINRLGKLEIKKPVYKTLDSDSTVILPEWEIGGNERIRTEFTDTRTYAKCITAYSDGKVKSYVSNRSIVDTQSDEGFVALRQNPLMKQLSEEEADVVNQNICNSISELMQRGIETDIFGNPAMECGDTVKLSGGVIDLKRRIIGMITRRTWKYRGGEKVICDNPVVWIREEDAVNPDESSSPKTDKVVVSPKSQVEKRIDAISSEEGLKPIYRFQVQQYGKRFRVNEKEYSVYKNTDGYVERISDEAGNTFYPDINKETNGDVDVERFNALVLPLVFARGIKGKKRVDVNFVTKWNLSRGNGGRVLTIPSQLGFFNCKVEWGDGAISTHSSGNLIHEYEHTGVYVVTISGQYNGICMANASTGTSPALRLEEVVNWGNVGFTSMNCAFRDCTYLTKIPDEPITGAENVIDFSYAFCNVKAHIPNYFFKYCKEAISFESVFSGLGGMIYTTFGKGLFKGCAKAIYFTYAFMGVSSMTVDNEMFAGCISAADFKKCFGGNNAGVLDMGDKVFKDCDNISNMENMMGYCHTYTISPSWVNLDPFIDRVVNFTEAFTSINSEAQVSGTAPAFWGRVSNLSTFNKCFYNSVGLSNYNSIPANWK